MREVGRVSESGRGARDAAVANRLAETEQRTSEKEKEGKGAEVVEDGEVEDGEVEDGEVEDGEVEDGEVEDGDAEPPPLDLSDLDAGAPRLRAMSMHYRLECADPEHLATLESACETAAETPWRAFRNLRVRGVRIDASATPAGASANDLLDAIRAAAAGADGFVDGSDGSDGGSNGRGCAIRGVEKHPSSSSPDSCSSDFVVEFDLFGHDVWRRGGVDVAPIRGESARLAYLDRREARLAADRDRHLHPHWLLAESESSRSTSSNSDWNPRASAWCPTDRLGALAVRASAASDFFSDATTSYEKDWERHAREIVAMDRMDRMDRGTEKGLKNPTPVPLREAWRLVVEDAWRDSVATLESEISRRREVVDVATRASETVAETRRKIDARRADPRLADARAADPPDERRVQTLEFELAESIAPLEVALDAAVAEEKIAKAEAAVAAAEATTLEETLARVKMGPDPERIVPAAAAAAASAARCGGVAFDPRAVAVCCDLTPECEAARRAWETETRKMKEAHEALKPAKGAPPPEPPEYPPEPTEVRAMTWRAFETLRCASDFGAPEECPARAKAAARAKAEEAERAARLAAEHAKAKKKKTKEDDEDEEEEAAAEPSRPPPLAFPGAPRITPEATLAFHEMELERIAAEAAAKAAKSKGKGKKAAAGRGKKEKEPEEPPPPPPPNHSARRAAGVFRGDERLRAAAGLPPKPPPPPEEPDQPEEKGKRR